MQFMTAQTGNRRATAITRRQALAAGAAGFAAMALVACSGEEAAATATRVSGTVQSGAGTVASAAGTQVPGVAGGIASTVQAAATQNPGIAGTVRAAGSAAVGTAQVAGSAAVGSVQAATSDVAARNNKYQGRMPPMTIDRAKKYFATFVTNKGTMRAELYADTAPITVNNFVFLANEKFYDGVNFHRIVPGFVIQGGDPTGMGTGGPGYRFMDEPVPATRNYEKGTLAMANSGPNTNGSQFFICLDSLTAQMKLPKMYSLFGKVIEGLDVVDAIAGTPVRPNPNDPRMERSQPTERVFMQTVTISTQ